MFFIMANIRFITQIINDIITVPGIFKQIQNGLVNLRA